MPNKPDESRVPSAVSGLPLVGELARSAEAQARWMQEMVEQNARLVGQFPATLKSFNDTLERFNETVGRLDRAVTRIEKASRQLTGPLEKLAGSDLPAQVARLQATIDRVVGVLAELPGAGILRRLAAGGGEPAPDRPKPR